MDPNNTNQGQTPVVPPPPSPEVQNAAPQPVPPSPQEEPVSTTKISPIDSIKIRIKEVKQSLGFNDPAKRKKVLVGGIALITILVLITVGYALIPKQVATPLPTIAPTPSGTEQPRGEPSAYANDPEVLRIMDSLEAFDQEADQTILREDDLRLPTIDWNVTFE